jgi:hypothetical protein
VLATIVVGLLALTFWLTPVRERDARSDVIAIWAFRLAASVGLVAAIRWVAAGSDDVVRRERLAALQPSAALECPVCSVYLIPGDPWRCPRCGMVRL